MIQNDEMAIVIKMNTNITEPVPEARDLSKFQETAKVLLEMNEWVKRAEARRQELEAKVLQLKRDAKSAA
jgi:hypothetical protein